MPDSINVLVTGPNAKTDHGAVGDGSTDDRAALAAADGVAVTASLPLMLPIGTYKVSSNLTIDSPVWFTPGSVIKPDDGITVTLAGGIASAPPSQIFDCSAGGSFSVKKTASHVTWYGAVGDGVTDSLAAINAAFASGENLHFPAGDYKVSDALTGPTAPMRIVGESGARIFIDDAWVLLYLQNSTDVTFENIIFETTLDDDTAHASGLVYSSVKTQNKTKFIGCHFLAENTGVDGALIIATDMEDPLVVDDVLFDRCRFRTGRMGLEVLDQTNHGEDPPDPDSTVRIRNVRAENCTFEDCGDIATGIAMSFCGRIEGAGAVGNRFYGGDTACIELAQDNQYPVVDGNLFFGLGDLCRPISVTNNVNDEYNVSPTIAQNKSVGRSGRSVYLWQAADARLYGNVFVTVDKALDVRNCQRLRANGEHYDGTGNQALWVASASQDCVWTESVITNSNESTNHATVRFDGTDTTNNIVRNSRLLHVAAGNEVDETNDAYRNQVEGCTWNTPSAPVIYRPYKNKNLSDANTSINMVDSDGQMIQFTGTLTAIRTVTFPRQRRAVLIRNATNYGLTIETVDNAGAALSIGPGQSSWIGFNDTTIVEFPTGTATSALYTVTNAVTDRAFDANSTTVEELADVLGTLIADLKSGGIIAS